MLKAFDQDNLLSAKILNMTTWGNTIIYVVKNQASKIIKIKINIKIVLGFLSGVN
jgi:hypothetical protein